MKKYGINVFDIVVFVICVALIVAGFMGRLTSISAAIGWGFALFSFVCNKIVVYYDEEIINSYKKTITKYEELIEVLKEGVLK